MKNWPKLSFPEIQDTLETLHQWIQIVGKIRLKTMPWQNHSWHTTLYITPTGYSTHGIPYGGRVFQIDFDFKHHQLLVHCSDHGALKMDLKNMTTAEFYQQLFELLKQIKVDIEIYAKPNEIDPAIPFAKNTINKTYHPEAATNLWLAMLRSNEVFNQFRSEFIGKCSPVHLFWGAFDLAVTRFSGKEAPLHPGGMPNMSLEVMQEAYSQEVSSAGFWPGSSESPEAMYYSYVYPTEPAFGKQQVKPKEAFYSEEMGEYFLRYDDVRNSRDPEKTLYDFLQSTYEAAAKTSGWNRKMLERK